MSNDVSWNSGVSPSFSAMSLPRSMSKPLKSASSGVPISNGGYGASVPISRVPSVIVCTSALPLLASVVVSELSELSSSLPHPAATSPSANTATSPITSQSRVPLIRVLPLFLTLVSSVAQSV